MNPDKKVESQEIVPEQGKYNFLIIALAILALFVVCIFLYSSITKSGQSVSDPVEDLVGPEVVVNESNDMDRLIFKKLEEVDEGQGFVNIATSTAGDMYLTKAGLNQTLYHRKEGFCVDECLQTWEPYFTDRSFEGNRIRSVLVNEEFGLHYVLLDDMMLFTYSGDKQDLDTDGYDTELTINSGDKYEEGTNGDGIDGIWTIARP